MSGAWASRASCSTMLPANRPGTSSSPTQRPPAGSVIPIDCPVCVVAAEHADDLPDELRADVVVVRTGTDLLRVMRSD